MSLLVNIALLLAISILWAAGIAIIKELLSAFPPIFIGAARATIASTIILAACLITRQKLTQAFKRSGAMALLGAVGIATLWSMLPIGEVDIDSSLATLLVAIAPFTALVVTALPPVSARVRWHGWAGLILGTAGLVLAIGPRELFDDPSTLTGVAWVAAAFVCFGVYCVLTEIVMKGLSPAPVAGVSILYASFILWVLVIVVESPLDMHPDTGHWLLLLALSALCTAIPNLLVYVLAKRASGVFVSLFGYIMPLIGILIGYLYFHTPIVWTLYLGIPLTFAGMALVQQARRKVEEN